MVKAAYAPLYHPRSVIFEKFLVVEGYPAQSLLLMDEKSCLCRAIYPMQRRLNDDWRIHRCCLIAIDDPAWQ
jgi:hypothetical protein